MPTLAPRAPARCAPARCARTRGALRLAAAAAALAASPALVHAQQTLTLSGRVYDPSSDDAAVAAARLTLAGHGVTLSASDGTFVFREVRAGSYQLRVEAPGYHVLDLRLRLARDTTVALALNPEPFELDSLEVVYETIDFDGRARDPATDCWVADAEIVSDQGHREYSNLFGRFDLDDVAEGQPLRLIIRAFGYLPLDTTFVPDDEERHPFDLAPDPVAQRMIGEYVARLDARAGERMYEFRAPLNREDLARFDENTSLRRLMEARYPLHVLRRIACIMIDEREYRFGSLGERLAVLEGTYANDIQRIELLEFPGYGRLFQARVYTRDWFQRHVGTEGELATPSVVATMGGTFCR